MVDATARAASRVVRARCAGVFVASAPRGIWLKALCTEDVLVLKLVLAVPREKPRGEVVDHVVRRFAVNPLEVDEVVLSGTKGAIVRGSQILRKGAAGNRAPYGERR